MLGDAAPCVNGGDCRPRTGTSRLYSLAAAAWKDQLLSEGQLADLLQVDRIALRKRLDEALDEVDADAALELPERHV